MARSPTKPRILVLANRLKPPVVEALRKLRPWLNRRAHIIAEPDIGDIDRSAGELPQADLAIVLGGDGTILSLARHLVDLDVPMLGVNFGKVGFLAEFNVDDLDRYWDRIAAGRCPISERLMLEVFVFDPEAADCRVNRLDMDHCVLHSLAMNDAVITAGSPFRMIEIDMAIDPVRAGGSATQFGGDGVIISTPSGSTAYSVAAGGPIVSPDADVLCITPNCAQSMAVRPIIVPAGAGIALRIAAANEGSALVIDGQFIFDLVAGNQIYARGHDRRLKLVSNPALNFWKTLAKKMHWAVRPRRV